MLLSSFGLLIKYLNRTILHIIPCVNLLCFVSLRKNIYLFIILFLPLSSMDLNSNSENYNSITNMVLHSTIRGMDKNIYFLVHGFDGTKNKGRRVNEYEIEMCIELKNHLVDYSGYECKQIRIISITEEQTDLMYKYDDGVSKVNFTKPTVVDGSLCFKSFTDERPSNDETNETPIEIVILSMVDDSCYNDFSQVEYIKDLWLSFDKIFEQVILLARTGFYIFGHKLLVKTVSDRFENFCYILEQNNCIGQSITLYTTTNQQQINLSSSSSSDLDSNIPIANHLCLQNLFCGHPCPRKFHPFDPIHNLPGTICTDVCGRYCPAGHPCSEQCHEVCEPCNVIAKVTYPCGHFIEEQCVLIRKKKYCEDIVYYKPPNCDHGINIECKKIKKYKCKEKCYRKLEGCKHICYKMCHEPCVPCDVFMNHQFENCGHIIYNIPCPEYKYTIQNCKKIILSKKAECGHDNISLPCFKEYELKPSEITSKYCNAPCNRSVCFKEEGGCGHDCTSLCKECYVGYHAPCKIPCGKNLICGHICRIGCPSECPPCPEICHTSCEHGLCESLTCGYPCPSCEEPCTWECPHHKCTKTCKDICNREPCNLNCTNFLNCGHPCVGFCGEPCSPLCRICDHDILLNGIFTGNDQIKESDRFVYLVDCKHTIENESLTKWMNTNEDSGEIIPKCCPLCRQIIWTCRRYNQILYNKRNEIILVKKKLYGIPENNTLKLKNILLDICMKTQNSNPPPLYFDDFLNFLKDKIRTRDGSSPSTIIQMSYTSVDWIEVITKIYFDVEKSMDQAKNKCSMYEEIIKNYCHRLFNYIKIRFPVLPNERGDICREAKRIQYILDLKIIHANQYIYPTLKNLFRKSEIQTMYKQADEILCGNLSFDLNTQKLMSQLLKNLSLCLRTTIGVTDKERNEILNAFGSMSGRWFKCKNGHVYVITECGGAMVTGICPECKTQIGGNKHQLLKDNDLATDMDGALVPLYPNTLQHHHPVDDNEPPIG